MGLFQNEAIRSLPEQVEKNKEDIKEINDILENIDPDEVSTILSDIASIKAEQVVQNTAINTNTGNITANATAITNETNSRKLLIDTNITGDTVVKSTGVADLKLNSIDGDIKIDAVTGVVNVDAHTQIKLNSPSIIATAEPNGLISLETDKSLITLSTGFSVQTNTDDTPHTLSFDNTGSLTIDGTPVGGGGGGSQLYQHVINIYNSLNPDLTINMSIINDSNIPLNTLALIASYLYNKGHISYQTGLPVSGSSYISNKGYNIICVYSSNGTQINTRCFDTTGFSFNQQTATGTITETIITL